MAADKPTNHRMMFLLLLESAMRHREATWREDVEHYRQSLRKAFEAVKSRFKTTKEHDKHKAAMNRELAEHDSQEMKFNGMIYHKIEAVEKTFTPDTRAAFDNLATAFSILAENLLAAKNSTELLTVAQLYNEGFFDEMLAAHFSKEKEKEAALNESYESKNNNNES